MTLFYSDLAQGISQQRRDQIEKRKEEIRHKWFETSQVKPTVMTKDVNLRETMDARVWASEFMRITGGKADEEIMISWFANSIMCGWDHHYWQSDEYKQLVAQALPEVKPQVDKVKASASRTPGSYCSSASR